ncbi:phage adaptor protein [Alteraurantiacibacter buctensis]|uniref:Uncharacterized protein n=1 Tax=Alteraurantiacibacter buctensis TaxID=1503981 RepID=A0A844Z065_9SPHN|nr:hypothetical protein [Alteraurantiacibacter buctensis]MXO72872.1 hypothetical protein [Alteraurantiacibacter buctensis]
MTITITLPEEIDIDSYGGLQAFLIRHLMLSDDTIERLPTLIRLGEVRLARVLDTPQMETTATILTTAGAQTVALPTDMEMPGQLRDSARGVIAATSIENVEAYGQDVGPPVVWARHGDTAVLGPVPDAEYTLALRYSTRLPFLNDNNTSNWLLSRHPDAYVWMCCAVICEHLDNMDSASGYLQQANAVIAEINARAVRSWLGHNLAPRVMVP